MACRLLGAKPLSEPMLIYSQLDKIEWNINQNSSISIQENTFENVIWKMAAILSRPQCVPIMIIDYPEHSLCNCPEMKAIIIVPYWQQVNDGSGNGLGPSGSKPLPQPMFVQIYDVVSCY